MIARAGIFISAVATAPFLLGAEESAGALLDEALRVYAAALEESERDLRLERFRQAERLFDRIIESGIENAELYVNRGNAALQAERLGCAVLAYRKALRLDPDHARARKNLEHARTLLPAWVPRPAHKGILDSFFFWHRTLSREERTTAAAICFALSVLLLALAVRWQRPWLRNLALLPGLAWLALLSSVALERAGDGPHEAVITAGEVVARAADAAHAPSPFGEPLPGGTEVVILEERERWLHVRLANGRDAWLPSASVTSIH